MKILNGDRNLTTISCPTAERDISDPAERGPKRRRKVPRTTRVRCIRWYSTWRSVTSREATLAGRGGRAAGGHAGAGGARPWTRRAQPPVARRRRVPVAPRARTPPPAARPALAPRVHAPAPPPPRLVTAASAHRRPHSLNSMDSKFDHPNTFQKMLDLNSEAKPILHRGELLPTMLCIEAPDGAAIMFIMYKVSCIWKYKGLINYDESSVSYSIIWATCSAM